MKKNIVSIFSGIDCLGIGFSKYFNTVLSVEKEKNACETLKANHKYHPNTHVMHADIYDIADEVIEQYKDVDGLIGGPPCQPFSPAKSRFDPTDPRIQGLTIYAKWVNLIRPKFFMFENTSGLVQKNKKVILDTFLENLRALGYTLSCDVLNAHDYGSVQNRKRVIVVGFRNDLHIQYGFPQPIEERYYVGSILRDNEPLEECLAYSEKRREIISYVPEGGNWRNLPNEELIKAALGGNYTKRQGGMTGVYKRLGRDMAMPTIVTTPLQRNTMACHPTEDRPLSLKESIRAQGIPEDYQLVGTLTEKYRFIGNGVPVELSTHIARSIATALYD